jgi:hypothetical protein
MATTANRPAPIALERTRLEHRAGKLDAVARELRKRARHHPAPHLLGRAIDGLDAELRAVRKRLAAGSR